MSRHQIASRSCPAISVFFNQYCSCLLHKYCDTCRHMCLSDVILFDRACYLVDNATTWSFACLLGDAVSTRTGRIKTSSLQTSMLLPAMITWFKPQKSPSLQRWQKSYISFAFAHFHATCYSPIMYILCVIRVLRLRQNTHRQ